LPYPDSGFGDGFRSVAIPLGWSVAPEPGRRSMKFSVLDTLKSMGIYRPGLFTFVVAASFDRRRPSIPASWATRW
jgi:hypothetical protein